MCIRDSHYTIGRVPEFILYLLGILGMVFTLMGNTLFGGGRELWYLYTSPNVVLTALALCALFRYVPVSYTHLDVYKRQPSPPWIVRQRASRPLASHGYRGRWPRRPLMATVCGI